MPAGEGRAGPPLARRNFLGASVRCGEGKGLGAGAGGAAFPARGEKPASEGCPRRAEGRGACGVARTIGCFWLPGSQQLRGQPRSPAPNKAGGSEPRSAEGPRVPACCRGRLSLGVSPPGCARGGLRGCSLASASSLPGTLWELRAGP